MDEKTQFAQRLKAAMIAAGYEARPSVLEKNFNARYWGRSVSYQAARRWLIGLSIPEQEKLLVLAQWLEVPPHALRFGVAATAPGHSRGMIRKAPSKLPPATAPDRDAMRRFLELPPDERRLVGELIDALSRRAQRRDGPGKPPPDEG